MTHRRGIASWQLAAIPYLLLSCSQEAGVITWVDTDGSGERVVYARSAPGRADEARAELRKALPVRAIESRKLEADGRWVRRYRDTMVADLAQVGEIEIATEGIAKRPFSIFTKHAYTETLSFDRGDATEVELHGLSLAHLRHAVHMPGKVLSQNPAADVKDGWIVWRAKVSPDPQTFTAESRTVRWAYLVFWLYVLVFVAVKIVGVAPRFLGRIRRKPRKI